MKFLIDAQLPMRLAGCLIDSGHECVHTSQLPCGNRTTDDDIANRADQRGEVVVTKDSDFRNAHLLAGQPRKLLIVSTGNISNTALLALFEANLELIVASFDDADFVELSHEKLLIRRRPDAAST